MSKLVLSVLVLGVFLVGCGDDEQPAAGPITTASATITEIIYVDEILYEDIGWEDTYEAGTKTIGSANFEYQDGVTTLTINLQGLTPNESKAVHLHLGTVEVPSRHWNAGEFYAFCNERSLGEPWLKLFAGDVGNVELDENGNGTLTIKTDLWSINTGQPNDVINTTVVVHQNGMNFELECDPNHLDDHTHENPKIGAGSVQLTSNETLVQPSIVNHDGMPEFTICN